MSTFAAASVLLAGLSAVPAFAAGNVRQQILQGEHAYTYGILHQDIKLLDRVFADDFLDTSVTGALRTKQQMLAIIANDPAPASLTESHRIIHIYNDSSAVVSVEFVAKGTDRDKPYTYRGRATDVWTRINGRWQCVAAHSSEIK
ncbi:MAG: nuclear transport factor 2 family protein [Gammaproteobacteria bacterium]